ncbi:hypothetical protein RJ639_039044 [Escallonia herrerae]|uniref:Sieve element occlusion N-terminal domain-containing protein n=1 Tax=Escallonia herrerae TaxID=1293975 RepID=A0AA88WIV6_9ASTE|nr:hypothetical protein RJ639_039044 [Escallonia herrerae]
MRTVRLLDSGMFLTSEEDSLWKQLQSTHAHDGREFDLKPILRIIDSIMRSAIPQEDEVQSLPFESNDLQSDTSSEQLMELAPPINTISLEISCKALAEEKVHGRTMRILNALSNYTWDVKVVLALAAFAVNYAELRLVAQLYNENNQLAMSVALLKQLPDVVEADPLKLKAITMLINALSDVTKSIVQYYDLRLKLGGAEPENQTALARSHIAVYWSIHSIVACASEFMAVISVPTTSPWSLQNLIDKLSHFSKQLQSAARIAKLPTYSVDVYGKCCKPTVLEKLWMKIATTVRPQGHLLPSTLRERGGKVGRKGDEVVVCQICGKKKHTALECSKRFARPYQSDNVPLALPASGQS